MSKNIIAAFVAVTISLVAASGRADTLLAKIKYTQTINTASTHIPPPESFLYSFRMTSTGDNWSRLVSATDIGITFHPEPGELIEMADAWHNPATLAGFVIDTESHEFLPNLSTHFAQLGSFHNAPFDWTVYTANPQATHNLTDVAISIDDWFAMATPVVIYGGAFTVQFFGTPIPEPTSFSSFALLSTCLGLRRLKSSINYDFVRRVPCNGQVDDLR